MYVRTVSTEAKKPSTFGFLRDLLVEETHDQKPVQPILQPLQPLQPVMVARLTAPAAAAPDAQMLARLEGLLRDAMPAPYKAFQEQYEKLAGVIPDEGTRFRAALATSSCTKADILKALDMGKLAMDKAVQDFQRVYDTKRGGIQATFEQSTLQITELIKSKEAQIQALQAQMQAFQVEIQTLQQSMQESDQKARTDQGNLDAMRAGFDASLAHVVARLDLQRKQLPERA